MFHGWLFRGYNSKLGKWVCYFWNDGQIVESKFFNSEIEYETFKNNQK